MIVSTNVYPALIMIITTVGTMVTTAGIKSSVGTKCGIHAAEVAKIHSIII
jgi:hypothetical protein